MTSIFLCFYAHNFENKKSSVLAMELLLLWNTAYEKLVIAVM